MIHLDGDDGTQEFPKKFSYCSGWNLFTRMVLPCTRYLRAINVERYMTGAERHLDVGCGDGYFLRRSTAQNRHGLDKLMGDRLSDLARFPDEHFDCVTMLAVIEHLTNPLDVIHHIWPVMKPGGRLIMTTPKLAAERLIRLYVPNIDEEHEHYFDRDSLASLMAPGFELQSYHTFIFGLNQSFCFTRKTALDEQALQVAQGFPGIEANAGARSREAERQPA